MEAPVDRHLAVRGLVGPRAGSEVVGTRIREARPVGGEPMADPQPSVRADARAGPISRERGRAARREGTPRLGDRVEGPQVVEEACARLAGEDDEAEVVDPDRLVPEPGRGSVARCQEAPFVGGKVVGPEVAVGGRSVAPAEQVGRGPISRKRPGVILAGWRSLHLEPIPRQRLRARRRGRRDALRRLAGRRDRARGRRRRSRVRGRRWRIGRRGTAGQERHGHDRRSGAEGARHEWSVHRGPRSATNVAFRWPTGAGSDSGSVSGLATSEGYGISRARLAHRRRTRLDRAARHTRAGPLSFSGGRARAALQGRGPVARRPPAPRSTRSGPPWSTRRPTRAGSRSDAALGRHRSPGAAS